MKKSLVRTIIYIAVVGGLFAGALGCFAASRGVQKDFKSINGDIVAKQLEYDAAAETEKAEIQRQIDKLQSYADAKKATYQVLAGGSYLLSIGGLAGFGICLAISDKIKQKEEDAAGRD